MITYNQSDLQRIEGVNEITSGKLKELLGVFTAFACIYGPFVVLWLK